ncbi:hypothetical protein IZY60_03520 [Lutibacter sp. B2]|nr:hypothetical protein [Lutibacter sp. B2]
MTEIFIKHNPYKIETEFKIDGEEIYSDSRLLIFKKEKLDLWINELITVLENELNEDSFKLIFNGVDIHYKKIKELCKYHNSKSADIKLEYIPAKKIEDKLKDIKNLIYFIQQGEFEELKIQDIQQSFNKVISCVDINKDTCIDNVRAMVQRIAQIIQEETQDMLQLSEHIGKDAKEKLKYTQNKIENILVEKQEIDNQMIQKNNLCSIQKFQHNIQFIEQRTNQEIENEKQKLNNEVLKMKELFNKEYPHITYTHPSQIEEHIIQEMVQYIINIVERRMSNMMLKFEKGINDMITICKSSLQYNLQNEKEKVLENFQVGIREWENYIQDIQNENQKKTELIQQKIDVLLLDKEKTKYNQYIQNKQVNLSKQDKILKKIEKLKKEADQNIENNNKQMQKDIYYAKEKYEKIIQNMKLEFQQKIQVMSEKPQQQIDELICNLKTYISSPYICMSISLKINDILKNLISQIEEKLGHYINPLLQYAESCLTEFFNKYILSSESFVENTKNIIQNKVYIEEIQERLETVSLYPKILLNVLEL